MWTGISSTSGPLSSLSTSWSSRRTQSSQSYISGSPIQTAADDARFHGICEEVFLELLAGAVEARHDGPDRHPEDVRRVLVGEAFDVDQEHHLAVEGVELLDRLHHLAPGDPVEDLRLGALAEVVAHLVVERELADVVDADGLPARLLEAVPVEVAHDREEPGLHVRAGLV